MSGTSRKLASSLETLYAIRSKNNSLAVRTQELSRTHRERLVSAGFLEPVVRGWYLITNPKVKPGETTSWNIAYWDFCNRYLTNRYGDQYYLSPEQSVLLHAGTTTIPIQLLIRAPKAPNDTTTLLHGTSLYSLQSFMPPEKDLTTVKSLRVLTPTAALVMATPTIFTQNPIECQALLSSFNDITPLLRHLQTCGNSTIAGRLVGGLRHLGLSRQADQIVSAMTKAYFTIREKNPFVPGSSITPIKPGDTPAIRQLQLRWASMRRIVLKVFPPAQGLPDNPEQYLSTIDKLYDADAYHSLSIENYEVSPALIERVKSGHWQPTSEDEQAQNALAARGYWNASLVVKASVKRILNQENAGMVLAEDLAIWFQELFSPSVQAGILRPADLAGYRAEQVYITNSRHIPPPPRKVFPLMETYFELLSHEPEASVRVVLGHFFLGFIHPFMDGNGRMARFLMNAMLASGGYPWLIIRVEDRELYMDALERASSAGDIEPFTRFLAERVEHKPAK